MEWNVDIRIDVSRQGARRRGMGSWRAGVRERESKSEQRRKESKGGRTNGS